MLSTSHARAFIQLDASLKRHARVHPCGSPVDHLCSDFVVTHAEFRGRRQNCFKLAASWPATTLVNVKQRPPTNFSGLSTSCDKCSFWMLVLDKLLQLFACNWLTIPVWRKESFRDGTSMFLEHYQTPCCALSVSNDAFSTVSQRLPERLQYFTTCGFHVTWYLVLSPAMPRQAELIWIATWHH